MKNYLLNLLVKLASVYHAARQFFKRYGAVSVSGRSDGGRLNNEKEVIQDVFISYRRN
jgi:hypothetical protein